MRVEHNKKTGQTIYHYKAPKGHKEYDVLVNEIQKCNKVVEDNSKYLDWYRWNYEKAKKEYESRVEKVKNHENFKRLLEDDVKNLSSVSLEEGHRYHVLPAGQGFSHHDIDCSELRQILEKADCFPYTLIYESHEDQVKGLIAVRNDISDSTTRYYLIDDQDYQKYLDSEEGDKVDE